MSFDTAALAELAIILDGPFTVSISSPQGKLWEIKVDSSGAEWPRTRCLKQDGAKMASVCVDILTGALRSFAGFMS